MALGDTLLSVLDSGAADDHLVGQITESLQLTPPKALERATALYVWKRQWEARLPDSRHGGDRRSAEYRGRDQNEKISFCKIAAEIIGVGERAIQLDIALCEDLGAEAIRRLWTTPIADNASSLKFVAALDAPSRVRLFDAWAADPKRTFVQAVYAAKLRAPADTDEDGFQKLLDGWQRASSKTRRRLLDEIGVPAEAAEAVIAKWRKRGTK
jgi:hypothetical protein